MDINTAIGHYQAGDRAAARKECLALIEQTPGHGAALLLLGRIALDEEEHETAEAHLLPVLQANPNNMHAILFVAASRLGQQRFQEAGEGFERVLSLHADVGVAWRYLGVCRLRLKEFGKAQHALSRAVELEPKVLQGWLYLGEVFFLRGRYEDAVTAYRTCLKLNPTHPDALGQLGAALARLGNLEEASSCCAQALSFDPGNATHRCQLGWIMLGGGHLERAGQRFKEVLKAEPQHEEGQVGLATVLERQGRHEQAQPMFEQLVKNTTSPSLNLLVGYAAVQRHCQDPEPAIGHIEVKLEEVLSNSERALAHHTLGALYEAIDQTDQAFAHYAQSNKLRNLKFDVHAHQRFIDAMIGSANAEILSTLPHPSKHSTLPIFIVGMPRSGTSLVEQILATHPQVYGSGEHTVIREMALDLNNRLGVPEPYPICLDLLNSQLIDELSQSYLSLVRAPSASQVIRVTDNTPFNYMHLGLINILFPGARVVHCVRDPLDTCLSCFFQNFNNTESYATSLTTLGAYHQAYRRLMVHWRGVSSVPILDFEYEKLVANPEAQIRLLLEFCGLSWDPTCLDFHENPRYVNSPSYANLRRPLFTTSVGRANRYARYLDPLRDALGI